MNTSTLLLEYEQLPDNYKQEASDFIEFLISKVNNRKSNTSKSRGGLGMSKGKYNMTKDFDVPLEDFREYME